MVDIKDKVGNVDGILAKFEASKKALIAMGEAGAAQRANIYTELVATEISYIEDLRFIGQEEKKQILAAFDKGPHAKNSQARKGLENLIDQYIALSKQQEKMLTALLTADPILWAREYAKMEGMYAIYTLTYREYQKYGAFPKDAIPFLASEQTNPRRLELQDFLPKPIQRMAKYPLLVKELVKAIPESHPHLDFQEAHHQITVTLDRINQNEKELTLAVKSERLTTIPRANTQKMLKELSLFLAGMKTVPKENVALLQNADLTEYLNKIDLSHVDLNKHVSGEGENKRLTVILNLIAASDKTEILQQNYELVDKILQAKIKNDQQNKLLIAANAFPIDKLHAAIENGQLYAVSDAQVKELGKNSAVQQHVFILGGYDGAIIHKNLAMLEKMGANNFTFSAEGWQAYQQWQAEFVRRGYQPKPVMIELGTDPQDALARAKNFQAHHIPVAFVSKTSDVTGSNPMSRLFKGSLEKITREKSKQLASIQALNEAVKAENEKIQAGLKAIAEGGAIPAPQAQPASSEKPAATIPATSLPIIPAKAEPSKTSHPILKEILQLDKQVERIQILAKKIKVSGIKNVELRPFVNDMWQYAQQVVNKTKAKTGPFVEKKAKNVTNVAKKVRKKIKVPSASSAWQKMGKMKPQEAYRGLTNSARKLKNRLIRLKKATKNMHDSATGPTTSQKAQAFSLLKLINQTLAKLKKISAFFPKLASKTPKAEVVIQRTDLPLSMKTPAPQEAPPSTATGSVSAEWDKAALPSRGLSFSGKPPHPLIEQIKKLAQDIQDLERVLPQQEPQIASNSMSAQVAEMLTHAQKALRTFGTPQEREASAQAAQQKKEEIKEQLHEKRESLSSLETHEPEKAIDHLITETHRLKAALMEVKKEDAKSPQAPTPSKPQAELSTRVDNALNTLEEIGVLLNGIKPQDSSSLHARPGPRVG